MQLTVDQDQPLQQHYGRITTTIRRPRDDAEITAIEERRITVRPRRDASPPPPTPEKSRLRGEIAALEAALSHARDETRQEVQQAQQHTGTL